MGVNQVRTIFSNKYGLNLIETTLNITVCRKYSKITSEETVDGFACKQVHSKSKHQLSKNCVSTGQKGCNGTKGAKRSSQSGSGRVGDPWRGVGGRRACHSAPNKT